MYIDPNWQILTVGDGDLSFSKSLFKRFRPKHLTATVLDSEQELISKYQDNSFAELRGLGVDVLTNFDITDPSSWRGEQAKYDLVIFQFPLVPGIKSKTEFQNMRDEFGEDFSINTLNRRLLRTFLEMSFARLLSESGARLAYISSKDVKPYIEWNIEDQLHKGLNIDYLGSELFNIETFPGYKIRNVDRDKHVKQTLALTYVWSDKEQRSLSLTPFVNLGSKACQICRAGPFTTEQEKVDHEASAKHKRMSDYNRQWQKHLSKTETPTAI